MANEGEVTYTERICVVIADEQVAEAEVRSCLGDSLPLHIVSWTGQEYLRVVADLRPRVVVVVEQTVELARDSAMLLANLLVGRGPTIASLGQTDPLNGSWSLIVWQLGFGAAAQICSLADLRLA